MAIPYHFHPQLVVRTPCGPFQPRMDAFDMDRLCRDTAFLEAIFVASPVLYGELIKYREGRIKDPRAITDLSCSVGKYYLRMHSRCTPFGLFSGCSVASWASGDTSMITANRPDRHTRLDMHYLCALAQHLASLPFIRQRLLYYPNSSWYRMGGEIRYVEYKYVAGKRNHLITAVTDSDYLAQILAMAQPGATWPALVGGLTAQDITEEEAQAFIAELVDAQVLVSELEPSITGDEVLRQIIGVLERIGMAGDAAISSLIRLLKGLDDALVALDQSGINEVERYEQIRDLISRIGIPFDEAKLFQADLSVTLSDNHVSDTLQAELLEALDILNLLNKAQETPTLQSFIRRFLDRYDQREMPLLEVLDTESGIGYLDNYSGQIAPLIEDMAARSNAGGENMVSWGKRDSFLMARLTEALAYQAPSIEFRSGEMAPLTNDWQQLPPSLSVLFRLVEGGKLLFEGTGGSSAINLLGRFTHANEGIRQVVEDIVAAEDRHNPDVIFAEIVHLPESRTGNVLLHPAFRRYEIPFLARPSVAAENCIPLQDILISVRNDQIVLRSKTLNQQIIPRLSTAHNFVNKTLPVYQFLCDLQAHKGQLGILFRWGILEFQCRFLPRVTCKNIIISAAQWNFYKKDIGAIIGKNGDELRIALAAFRQQWRVPVLVVLADGDNELFINFDDDRMVGIWLDAVRNRPGFVLKEFLPPGGSHAVRDREGRPYTSQLIAILQRSTAAYPATPSLTSASAASSAPPVSSASPAAPVSPPQAASTSPAGAGQQPVQRDFSAGSEWVYFKIYCGDRTADRILVQAIYPEVMRCLENRRIDRFFFLRYSDSGFHLRLRLHLTDLAHLGTVIHDLAERLKPFQTGGSISKVQLDTYQRETERYGSNSIDLAEEIFFHDSLAVLEMLAATEGMDRDELRWLWALRSIDEFFDGLAWTLMQRQSLAEYLKEAFHREFKVDKTLRSQLSGKYRQYRGRVQDILDRTKDAANGWQTALLPLNLRMEGLRPAIKRLWQMNAAGQLEIGMHELLYSYIHMMVNRVITSDPRLHELVLYDLLFAHYRSQTERSRNQQKKMTSAA